VAPRANLQPGLQPALVHSGQTALPGAGHEQHRRGLRVDVSRSVPACRGSLPVHPPQLPTAALAVTLTPGHGCNPTTSEKGEAGGSGRRCHGVAGAG
jgi:hypothetical protein